MDKKSVVTETNFGSRIAEEEGDTLSEYFVETEQWRKVISGDVDVIYGPKGSGKSAIYSLLVREGENLRLGGRRTVMIPAENPRGNPAFQGLVAQPPTGEEEFRGLWKFYFIILLAEYVRKHRDESGVPNADATYVIEKLIEDRLLEPQLTNLVRALKRAYDYVRIYMPKVEAGITDPHTGATFTGKIILGEPSVEQRQKGFVSADDLISKLNTALTSYNINVWLLIDRLDVAFVESSELEANALKSLFRVYLDLIPNAKISVKIFLRDDIWKKVSAGGFREASHITKTLTISWDQSSLLNLVVRRLLHNQAICDFYAVTKDDVLKNASLQSDFFYRVFPDQIEIGKSRPKTIVWMLSRIMDGSRKPAPRELIHLLAASRDSQLKSYEIGNSEPLGENLFDRASIKAALPEVSKTRFEQTLCAEYPSLKATMDRLEGEKTEHSVATLAVLWRLPEDKAHAMAERLAEIGFFERKGTKEGPSYWVPFLYRDALNMIQGSAETAD
jgi:hypothetical protein